MYVWLTAVVITPIIYNLIMLGHKAGMLEAFCLAIPMIIFGEVYSIPSWLILSCIVWALNDFAIGMVIKKVLLMVASILLVWLPFWCINFFGEDAQGLFGENGVFILCATYWIFISFGIWFYKLNPTFTKPNSDQLDQIS